MNGMLMNVLPHTSISGYTHAHLQSLRICRASTNLAKTITMYYFKYAFLCETVGVLFVQTTAALLRLVRFVARKKKKKF